MADPPFDVWNGVTPTRGPGKSASPDATDWDTAVHQIQATQAQVVSLGAQAAPLVGLDDYVYNGPGQIVTLSWSLPLAGATISPHPIFGLTHSLVAGLTGTNTVERIIGNNRVALIVAPGLIGSGNVVIAGDSVHPDTGVPTLGDTEVIAVNQPGNYQTTKFWLRVTSVTIPVGISLISYGIAALRYTRFGDAKYALLGYSVESLKQAATNASLRVRFDSIKDQGGKRFLHTLLEDITLARHPGVADNARVGGTSRSYNANVANYFDNPSHVFGLRQLDWQTYFTGGENVLDNTLGDGFQAFVEWTNVSTFTLYVYLLRLVN